MLSRSDGSEPMNRSGTRAPPRGSVLEQMHDGPRGWPAVDVSWEVEDAIGQDPSSLGGHRRARGLLPDPQARRAARGAAESLHRPRRLVGRACRASLRRLDQPRHDLRRERAAPGLVDSPRGRGLAIGRAVLRLPHRLRLHQRRRGQLAAGIRRSHPRLRGRPPRAPATGGVRRSHVSNLRDPRRPPRSRARATSSSRTPSTSSPSRRSPASSSSTPAIRRSGPAT